MMFVIHAHPTLYEALGDGFASVYGTADQRVMAKFLRIIEEVTHGNIGGVVEEGK